MASPLFHMAYPLAEITKPRCGVSLRAFRGLFTRRIRARVEERARKKRVALRDKQDAAYMKVMRAACVYRVYGTVVSRKKFDGFIRRWFNESAAKVEERLAMSFRQSDDPILEHPGVWSVTITGPQC